MSKERKLLRRLTENFEKPVTGRFGDLFDEVRELLSTPEQTQDEEPVAWVIPGGVTENKDLAQVNGSNAKPLYLHPAPRKSFMRLSEEECISIHRKWVDSGRSISRFARAIEDALEEKNK